MDTVEYDVNDFESREAGDKSVYAKFYLHSVPDEAATKEAGRPMYKEVEYVEIMAAGNPNNIVRRPAREMDINRFYRQYQMFKEGVKEQITGTPLKEVAWLTRAQVDELSYMKIHSLEALAGLDDNVCNKFAGMYNLKNKANLALEAARSTAPILALQEENENLKNQINALQEAVQEQTKLLKELQAKK